VESAASYSATDQRYYGAAADYAAGCTSLNYRPLLTAVARYPRYRRRRR